MVSIDASSLVRAKVDQWHSDIAQSAMSCSRLLLLGLCNVAGDTWVQG